MTTDEKNWAVFCHLSQLLGFLVPGVGNFLGPLVIWFLKKDEYAFVDDQGRAVINFQLTLLAYALVGWLLTLVLIGIVILWLLPIYAFVMALIGANNANAGTSYRYPFAFSIL